MRTEGSLVWAAWKHILCLDLPSRGIISRSVVVPEDLVGWQNVPQQDRAKVRVALGNIPREYRPLLFPGALLTVFSPVLHGIRLADRRGEMEATWSGVKAMADSQGGQKQ